MNRALSIGQAEAPPSGPRDWERERCVELGRHDGRFSRQHSQLECPVQLDPAMQAQWDRFDRAQDRVLSATRSTHLAGYDDGEGGIEVRMPLAEFERLATWLDRLARLKRLLRELSA